MEKLDVGKSLSLVGSCCLYLLLFVELLRWQSDDKVCSWKLEYDLFVASGALGSKKIVGWFLSWGRRFFFLAKAVRVKNYVLSFWRLKVLFLASTKTCLADLCVILSKKIDCGASRQSDSLMATTSPISYLVGDTAAKSEQQSTSTDLHEQRWPVSCDKLSSIANVKIGQVATDGTTQGKFMPVSPVSPSDATPAGSFTLW